MSNDVDVKVGIQVTGDSSGAQQVDAAVKQVGETAKQVAQETAQAAQQSGEQSAAAAQNAAEAAGQAAEKVGDVAEELGKAGQAAGGLGELDGAVDGLKDALGGLSPEKSKNLINGLTQALLGLGSGDLSTGLAGVGKSLFNFASLIPLPGAAAALGFGVSAIAALYKLIGDSTDEPARKLNEFGETVDQEMERLESWARSQFEWEGIKNANAAARADFDLLKTSAETALTAVQGLFNAKSSARVSALQREASAAEAAGDPARAAQLKQQVEDEKAKAELVNLHTAMTAAKAEAAEQTALLQTAQQNSANQEAYAKEAADRLAAIQEQIVARTGNSDAAVPGSDAASAFLSALEARLSRIESLSENTVSYLERTNNPEAANFRSLKDDEAPVRQLIEDIKNLKDISDTAADSEKTAADAKAKTNEEAIKATTSLTELGLKIETLKTQIGALESTVSQELAAQAQQQAGLMAGAVGDFLESTLNLATTDVQGIIAAKTAAVDALSTSAGDLETAKAAYVKQVALEEIPPVMEDATKKVGEGAAALASSIAETGTAGGEIKAGAEQFRQQLGQVLLTWQPTVSGLVDSGHKTLDLISGLAAAQAELARRVAATQADVGLVQSQIRAIQ